jgi:proline iminopeptidase
MDWTTFRAGGLVGCTAGDGDLLTVFLHGGPGLTDYMEGCADEVLAGAGDRIRAVRYQQRGQAPSTLDGPLSMDQFVADVFAVADHFVADRVVLVGHSWGGHLAMHAAVADPARIAALLLIDPLGGVGDGGRSTMNGVFQQRVSSEAWDQVIALPATAESDEQGEARLRLVWPGYFADPATAPPMPPIGFSRDVSVALWADIVRLQSDGHLERGLHDVVAPTHYLVGLQSPIDPETNQATVALLPSAMLQTINCGHFPWLESPGSITDAAARLLARVPTGG